MKLTKQQLKQIIGEELEVLQEDEDWVPPRYGGGKECKPQTRGQGAGGIRSIERAEDCTKKCRQRGLEAQRTGAPFDWRDCCGDCRGDRDIPVSYASKHGVGDWLEEASKAMHGIPTPIPSRSEQMKITKSQLRQIIREELSMVLNEEDISNIEYEEAFGTTEPRYTEGAVSPEQQLVNALFVRARIESMSPEEVIETLALEPTEEMLAYIQQVQGSSFLADPGRI